MRTITAIRGVDSVNSVARLWLMPVAFPARDAGDANPSALGACKTDAANEGGPFEANGVVLQALVLEEPSELEPLPNMTPFFLTIAISDVLSDRCTAWAAAVYAEDSEQVRRFGEYLLRDSRAIGELYMACVDPVWRILGGQELIDYAENHLYVGDPEVRSLALPPCGRAGL